MDHDFILRNGRVVDPGSGRDEVTDVAFGGGKVAAVGPGLRGRAERDVTGCLVMPGNIDFHAHVYWGGTSISVDADQLARRCGTTTWLDVGSAGPGNFAGFRKHVMAGSQTRILAYLHVSHAGIFAFSPQIMVGESQDMRLMDTETCAAVAKANPDLIRGIKVRVGANTSGVNGIAPLFHALEAAEMAGLPVMVHIDRPPPRYTDVLKELRPGDTLTHCFKPFPNAPLPRRWPGEGGLLGSARARRVLRHRARQGLVRLRRGGSHAGRRLPARHHQLGRARALHRRAGVRQYGDDEQVPPSRHGGAGHRARGDPHAGQDPPSAGPGGLVRRQHGRRDSDADRGRTLRVHRRVGKTRMGRQRFALDSMVVGGALWHTADRQAMAAD